MTLMARTTTEINQEANADNKQKKPRESCDSGEPEVNQPSRLHLPDAMDVLDCVTDFSSQLLLIKHNLVERT